MPNKTFLGRTAMLFVLQVLATMVILGIYYYGSGGLPQEGWLKPIMFLLGLAVLGVSLLCGYRPWMHTIAVLIFLAALLGFYTTEEGRQAVLDWGANSSAFTMLFAVVMYDLMLVAADGGRVLYRGVAWD